jgi:hypothetical protein
MTKPQTETGVFHEFTQIFQLFATIKVNPDSIPEPNTYIRMHQIINDP